MPMVVWGQELDILYTNPDHLIRVHTNKIRLTGHSRYSATELRTTRNKVPYTWHLGDSIEHASTELTSSTLRNNEPSGEKSRAMCLSRVRCSADKQGSISTIRAEL